MSVQRTIEEKLLSDFKPTYLLVENESHRHSVPPNSETHFKVIIASNEFLEKRLVARHQGVYRTLAEELQSGVHALAIHTYTDDEWIEKGNAPSSPPCLGGSKLEN